ncbi:Hypothetical predicted protein [Olea europaea subsp. europaea]|uniref:Uncharacterized protein n=1 Tax=Olea europaea subsp. europaea TaxID=158383 RepID=A0A8S0TD28_OLEEU|nr:Hypothetical predicted protein [Olea europaea subsp. europaea]
MAESLRVLTTKNDSLWEKLEDTTKTGMLEKLEENETNPSIALFVQHQCASFEDLGWHTRKCHLNSIIGVGLPKRDSHKRLPLQIRGYMMDLTARRPHIPLEGEVNETGQNLQTLFDHQQASSTPDHQ